MVSAITSVLMRALFRVRVLDVSNVPTQGPAILAFNHVSVLDGPTLGIEVARRRRRESRFLVAAEVFRKPVTGWVLRSFDQIPIRRGEGDVVALQEAVRTVSSGAIAALAPEGTVNGDGATELLRIRRGTARLALSTCAPVIPVGIWGTQRRWSKNGRHYGRPLRPRLAFVFGEALVPLGDPAVLDDIDAFTQRVREGIEQQVARAKEIAGPA